MACCQHIPHGDINSALCNRGGHAPIFADAHHDPHIFADHPHEPHGSATAWSSLVVTLFGTYYFLELEVQSFLDQFCKYGHECQYNFCIIKCLDHGHRYKNCLLQKPLFLWPGWRFVCWDPREKITLYTMGLIFTHPCIFRRFCPDILFWV